MKERGICMTPTVLLYNLDSEKGRKIKTLCLTLKLRAKTVGPEEFSQTLEAVLGLAPQEEAGEGGEPFSQEMLVMAGRSSQQMNQLLQGMRRKKIPPVELKAVLTASNGSWNAYQLHRELSLEHEAMLRGENLHEGKPL